MTAGGLRAGAPLPARGFFVAIAAAACALACPGERRAVEHRRPDAQAAVAAGGAGDREAPRAPAHDASAADDRTDASAAASAGDRAGATLDPSLAAEKPEANPRSQAVTIRLIADPPKRARVFWGVKDLGWAPLEIERPRGSGPLDLVLRAPGFLTMHTRAFTDRDDRITVHLVPEADAVRQLGYRPPAAPASKPKPKHR